jgi:uncharacterized protein (TIGR02271 family)
MFLSARWQGSERNGAMPATDDVIPIVEETATLEKRDVVTGRVRVHTQTSTQEEMVSAALERTDVQVTRVPVEREIDAAPPIRTEGDVTIIPVVEEILVVEKRLVLREEIHVRQTATTQSVEVPVTLRKQEAVIDRQDVTANPNEEEH